MYTGTLIIPAFGNDTTTGTVEPYNTNRIVGIPLTGNCHQGKLGMGTLHLAETISKVVHLPPQNPTRTETNTFFIPTYGGATLSGGVDTNGDTVPDFPPGCGPDTVSAGDPLIGGPGAVSTTGTASITRATTNPRKFTLPPFALRKHKTGASFEQYGVYLWEVHFADLHNDVGVFSKGGGDGSFAIKHNKAPTKRSVNQTAGKNQFGGTMRLLGIYGDFEGYFYNNAITSVFTYDWLFDYLGASGQATKAGVVTGGYLTTLVQYGHTLTDGYTTTSTAAMEVFKWTTGKVTVTARGGTFPTVLVRTGYDARNSTGSGVVQMVSPMVTAWTGAGTSSTAGIGILKVTFAPEPSEWMLLASGVSMLGLMAWRRGSTRP
jgi:hypothetical protein